MKSKRVFIEVFIIFLSLQAALNSELKIVDSNLFENEATEQINGNLVATSGDIDRIWGAINSDSVRIGVPIYYSRTAAIGTIVTANVTLTSPRIFDGLRLRSMNNTGGVGEIIAGGIGFNFATFTLAGHSNYFLFIFDAFENYTSSLIPPNTPTPDRIAQEWGTINDASMLILPRSGYSSVAYPGEIINENVVINGSRIIDGLRLISRNNTVANGQIIEGGIGFTFVTVRVTSNANYLNCIVERFANGTGLNPEETVTEWGIVDEDTRLAQYRFRDYPQPGYTAEDNATWTTTGIILGIRLTSLNYTGGVWDLIDGGLNQNFVTFNFRGAGIGRPYDFNVEIFGNSAITIRLSIILVILSSILFILVK